MMKDVPIIFSALMIRALLEGRKTQTRRLAWAARDVNNSRTIRPSTWTLVVPGDRLYVKETHWRWGRWRKDGETEGGKQRWRFRAEAGARWPSVSFDPKAPSGAAFGEHPPFLTPEDREAVGWRKRPSIFHPRKLSRLTLVVTAAKVERLNEISADDRLAEGETPACPFGDVFKMIHGDDIFSRNPEIVALTFTVHKQNIDTMPKDIAA
jgi:hypothetical protein